MFVYSNRLCDPLPPSMFANAGKSSFENSLSFGRDHTRCPGQVERMARRKRELYLGNQELEVQFASAVHGDDNTAETGVYSRYNSWKPLNPGHRVFLFCQRFKGHQIWRIMKRQSFSLLLRLLYHIFQTDFSAHIHHSQTQNCHSRQSGLYISFQSIAFCCLDVPYFDPEHVLSLGYALHLSS